MSSKIKQYFANKENRIKCGITGGTIALAVIIFVGMVFMEENETQNNSIETVSQTESDTQTEEETGYSFDAGDLYDMRLDAQTIEDYYMKSCGDQFNLYTIDEDGVLWGSGHNEYAQIGLGYADEEFHEEKSKIAEHVVHVDYSQKDFVVYLTEEGKLYGLGNDSTYMLLQHTEMPVEDLAYPTKRYVTSPALLLEDVSYARCGRDDVVALKKDGTVWTWGMIWNYQSTGYCITMPQQILTDVKMITGGWFNHAALKEDGTLWTWGYNFSGNCGTDKATMIETPVQVAEDVQRVWTGLLNYSAKEDDITDMEEFGNDYVDNTIIEKTDGTFYACGMGVGDKSVVLPQYYEVSELDTVCSSEFLPLDWDEEMLNRKQREYIERKESQSEEAVLARKNEALLEEIDKNYDMEKLKRKVPRFSEDDKINETYYNAIKTLDTTGFLPDGRYCFYIEQDGRTDVERFQEQRAQHYSPERVAVADVDDDGTAELLFFIEGTCVRDSAEYVYRYSEEKNAFELEFEYSAGCNYYQNGVIKAKPLYSGFIYQDDFWPYSVFQYDENKNEFVLTASVEEIPKAPENPDNFPEEYDKDGDGKVYIISQGESVAYMDEKEYLAWEKQVFWIDSKRCLRPMLAPHLYEYMREVGRLRPRPVRLFEVGPCFRRETQGQRHANEFTMLNLVEMGLPEGTDLNARLRELGAMVLDAAGIEGWRMTDEDSAVYGETSDFVDKNGMELASSALGPHPLDAAWGIMENWVGIGFGLERLTMAATGESTMGKTGRSLSYLHGIRLRI